MRVTTLILFILTSMALAEAKLPDLGTGINAIYGVDDRQLVTEKSPPYVREVAKSVAMIVSVDFLDSGLLRTFIKAPTLKESLNMCVSENFTTRPSVNNCTAFLVAPDIMATAGHCIQSAEDCATKKIIFDVDAHNQSKTGYTVMSYNVYSCKEVIANEYSETHDYTLFRLEKVIKKRKPLKLNLKQKIADNAMVFMVGHPLGLPLMHSKEVKIGNNNGPFQFLTSLDSFEGNSGSPVVNYRTLEVEGILVNGQEDFVQDPSGECYRNKTYEGAGGEGVTRISEIAPFLK